MHPQVQPLGCDSLWLKLGNITLSELTTSHPLSTRLLATGVAISVISKTLSSGLRSCPYSGPAKWRIATSKVDAKSLSSLSQGVWIPTKLWASSPCSVVPKPRPVKSHALRVWHTQLGPFTRSHANQDYSHAFLFMPGTWIWPAVLQVSETVESKCHVY